MIQPIDREAEGRLKLWRGAEASASKWGNLGARSAHPKIKWNLQLQHYPSLNGIPISRLVHGQECAHAQWKLDMCNGYALHATRCWEIVIGK